MMFQTKEGASLTVVQTEFFFALKVEDFTGSTGFDIAHQVG